MNELLNKISSYNIFNYLFPGAVFSILAERLGFLYSPDGIIRQLIWYYFVGMVISRIGSLMLEPVLRKSSFVHYASYFKYLRACTLDPKLEVMVEVSNMYRTLAAAFAVLLFGPLFEWLTRIASVPVFWKDGVAVLVLFVVFLVSFRKQSSYVSKRVNHHEAPDSLGEGREAK